MGSGRLPAARVVHKQKEKWGGRPQQPRHAAHARTQVRALHRHVALQDQVRRAVLGPLLLHVRSSRVRRPPTLVPPGGRPLLPRHHLLLPLLPLLSRATQQAGRQLADGGVSGSQPALPLPTSPPLSPCLSASAKEKMRIGSTGLTPTLLLGSLDC